MSDGNRFVALDGSRLEDEGAVSKRSGVGSGVGCGVYAEAVEVVVLWDGGLEQLVEDVWIWLEAMDGVVEGSVLVWVEGMEAEHGYGLGGIVAGECIQQR